MKQFSYYDIKKLIYCFLVCAILLSTGIYANDEISRDKNSQVERDTFSYYSFYNAVYNTYYDSIKEDYKNKLFNKDNFDTLNEHLSYLLESRKINDVNIHEIIISLNYPEDNLISTIKKLDSLFENYDLSSLSTNELSYKDALDTLTKTKRKLSLLMQKFGIYGNNLSIYLDGELVYFDDSNPILKDSRTFVPVRFISEKLGADIEWLSEEKTVSICKDKNLIYLPVQSDIYIINGRDVKLDAPAFIMNSKTYVPLRFISEALDIKVKWKKTKYNKGLVFLFSENPPHAKIESIINRCLIDNELKTNFLKINEINSLKEFKTIPRNKRQLKAIYSTSPFVNRFRYDIKYLIDKSLDFLYLNDKSMLETTELDRLFHPYSKNLLNLLGNDKYVFYDAKCFYAGKNYFKIYFYIKQLKNNESYVLCFNYGESLLDKSKITIHKIDVLTCNYDSIVSNMFENDEDSPQTYLPIFGYENRIWFLSSNSPNTRTSFYVQKSKENEFTLSREVPSKYVVYDDWKDKTNAKKYKEMNYSEAVKILNESSLSEREKTEYIKSGFNINIYGEIKAVDPEDGKSKWYRLMEEASYYSDYKSIFSDYNKSRFTQLYKNLINNFPSDDNEGAFKSFSFPAKQLNKTNNNGIEKAYKSNQITLKIDEWRISKFFDSFTDENNIKKAQLELIIPYEEDYKIHDFKGIISLGRDHNYTLKSNIENNFLKIDYSKDFIFDTSTDSFKFSEVCDAPLLVSKTMTSEQALKSKYSNSSEISFRLESKDGIEYKPIKKYIKGYKVDGETDFIYKLGKPTQVGYKFKDANYNLNFDFYNHIPPQTHSPYFDSFITYDNSKDYFGISIPSATPLYIYPDIMMIYDNEDGNTTAKFVKGLKARQINPVSTHSLKINAQTSNINLGYAKSRNKKAHALAKAMNSSDKIVIEKGQKFIINYENDNAIKLNSYSLDFSKQNIKTSWGNSSYSTSNDINSYFNYLGIKNNELKGKISLDLLIDSKLYNKAIEDVTFIHSGRSDKIVHNIEIRSGKVISVDGISYSNLGSGMKSVLSNMKLNPYNSSILDGFINGGGAELNEQIYNDLSIKYRHISNPIGTGWYNEDSTELVIIEQIDYFNIIPVSINIKTPINIKNLPTPLDKDMEYTRGKFADVKINLSIDSIKNSNSSNIMKNVIIIPNAEN